MESFNTITEKLHFIGLLQNSVKNINKILWDQDSLGDKIRYITEGLKVIRQNWKV